MLDLFHLTGELARADVQIYNRPSLPFNDTQWMTWQKKPRGVSMAHIIILAGGAVGGAGFAGVAASARGGGGGGGGASCTRLTVPIFLLPDRLYVQVGAGGLLGVVNGPSYVSVAPNTTGSNVIAHTYAPGQGGSGTASAGGAGGAATSYSVESNMIFTGLGCWASIGGQAGGAGGAHTGANGTDVALYTGGAPAMGGTGGGGTTSADFRGGDITGAGWLGEQKPASGVAGSVPGSGGAIIWNPLFFMGGVGGGSSDAGVGGAGGIGGYGSGGGGGGGGTTGGVGGAGGGGLVIIITW